MSWTGAARDNALADQLTLNLRISEDEMVGFRTILIAYNVKQIFLIAKFYEMLGYEHEVGD